MGIAASKGRLSFAVSDLKQSFCVNLGLGFGEGHVASGLCLGLFGLQWPMALRFAVCGLSLKLESARIRGTLCAGLGTWSCAEPEAIPDRNQKKLCQRLQCLSVFAC